ncbi:Repair protein Rad1/Rec1 [Lasiodiplodia theobromae]|uniref:DNA damage checkpoint control protein rad1 n=1 Tax=Lasiodiplodia theobromae TaxID=45133 RepID=A0A5N5DT42_9PEZI|nr:DNA damage checkpoint control protein rad1 [Lasiodiplodia theobromae]KAF9635880.1 Repair protein Rad1/Rec1 [Lasiodiplodia theobromae]
MSDLADGPPVLSAVSGSARQLFILLRCIGFAQKVRVQITEDGLRFSAEDNRVMQGFAFLDKTLFTTFLYNPPRSSSQLDTDGDGDDVPAFAISLPSLLETLQIFGLTDPNQRNPYAAFGSREGTNAFDNRVLGMTSLCRLSYEAPGAPLKIVLEEAGVTTTCELTTYELDEAEDEDIPFARDELAMKIIMRSSFLHDAVAELGSTNPENLALRASPTAPFFSLSASGTLGSTVVEFDRPENSGPKQQDTTLLETFQVAHRVVYTYRFALIKAAARAMAAATKVSIRGDSQGVLSLQFMVEVDSGQVSFIDFRFVPLIEEEAEEGDEDSDGDSQR